MRRMISLIAAGSLAATALVAASALPASAQAEVTGQGACQPDGSYRITWTVDNMTGSSMNVEGASLEGVATQVVFSPNPVPASSSATGTSSVAGTVAGTLGVQVQVVFAGDPPSPATLRGSIDVPGNCPQPVATTTVTPTTAAQQPAVVAAPRFTG